MKTKVLLGFFLLISGLLKSQSDTMIYKPLVHTFNIEALSIGYTISQQIKESNYFGLGLQLGASYRYFLNNPSLLLPHHKSESTSEQSYSTTKLKPAINSTIEIVQVKLFYKKYLLKTLYFNTGIYFGVGFLRGIENSKAHGSFGIFSNIFYGFEHFKLGTGIMIGDTHITYDSSNKTNVFSVLLTPVILQVNF